MDKQRLIVVSNRLPVAISRDEEGEWRIAPGSGGLVTALAPVMRNREGVWLGWAGTGGEVPLGELFERFGAESGYRLQSVPISEEEIEKYYLGFSNETLWPLFHDLLGYCNFDPENWRAYIEVNRRFAEAVAATATEQDQIWIHDYQLCLVGGHLRELGVRQPLAFFLHIPFPSLDLFRRLPWKQELIRGLVAYDLVGFQTLRDRRNFVQCAAALIPELEVISRQRHYTLLRCGERTIKVGHFPISIDYNDFHQKAQTREVADAAWYLHESLSGRQLMLGVDRLDYTKGIPERFLAFERALELYPELRKNLSLLQVVIPSRTLVPDYRNLKELLDQMAGRINARFAEPDWMPIFYLFRSLEPTQLLAHYRTSEIALITPLRDGMNLVAKEYCASAVDLNNVLILSEFAGAADQLGHWALTVNPYDIDGTAAAIHRAFHMPREERRERMQHLQAEVERNDVHRWVRRFLGTMQGGRHG
ncbi:MAG: trehalose-6-phosphate synthase [Desulfuromonadales bacterium]|nr:trehalose-6-phosphate synthase [Desulfuromonadales bacterium]